MKRLLSLPLFWSNVVTAVVAFVLVGTIVFGWTNPLLDPPQGGGAIQLDSQGNLELLPTSPTGTAGDIEVIGSRRIVAPTWPTGPDHVVNQSWVMDYVGQQGAVGGKTLITLWGRCSAPGSTCAPGQGTTLCSVLGSNVSTVYNGYGPFVWTGNQSSGAPSPALPSGETTVDSSSICSGPGPILGINPNDPTFPTGGLIGYRATWPDLVTPAGGWYGNTCRVCLIDGGYAGPAGGFVP